MTGASDDHTIITELIHRYAYYVRLGHGERCGDLFTESATYELREIDPADPGAQSRRCWHLEGREAIGGYIGKSTKSGIRICPMIHNVMIEISGDTARSNCIMTSETWPTGRGSFGEYDDGYCRDGGIWRFQSRIYTIFRSSGDNPP